MSQASEQLVRHYERLGLAWPGRPILLHPDPCTLGLDKLQRQRLRAPYNNGPVFFYNKEGAILLACC
jgi:hypothetical protein